VSKHTNFHFKRVFLEIKVATTEIFADLLINGDLFDG